MITLQGDMMCSTTNATKGLRRDTQGFGDTDTVDRLRQSLGFVDPYGLSDVDRYMQRGKKELRAVGMPPLPCCKKDCKSVGACADPLASVRTPDATCLRCTSNMCDGTC